MKQYLALLRQETELKLKAGKLMKPITKGHSGPIVKQEKPFKWSADVKRRLNYSKQASAWESKR